jgi:hypothetical protein
MTEVYVIASAIGEVYILAAVCGLAFDLYKIILYHAKDNPRISLGDFCRLADLMFILGLINIAAMILIVVLPTIHH